MEHRFGIVGGGKFIGGAHIAGARLDGRGALVCGMFSRDETKNTAEAKRYGAKRWYSDYEAMAREERRLGELELVIVCVPNALHFAVAKTFLEAGFDVACDKPVTVTALEAMELKRLAREHGRRLCVTYTLYGFPMLSLARRLIADGALGELMMTQGTYLQQGRLPGLLDGTLYEKTWKMDPERVGMASTLFDIGVHLDFGMRYVTGLTNDRVLALNERIPCAPPLETTSLVTLRYREGAVGSYLISQVAAGCANEATICVYGTKAHLRWSQSDGGRLYLCPLDGPERVYTQPEEFSSYDARTKCGLPAGHPEGMYGVFGRIYRSLFNAMEGDGQADYPDIDDGIAGVRFVEACVKSAAQGNAWQTV